MGRWVESQPPAKFVLLLVGGLGLVALGIVAIAEMRRYTPIYDDIVCVPNRTALGSVTTDPSLHLRIDIDIICENPNPYDIVLTPGPAGQGLLGAEKRDFGVITTQPSFIPAAPARGQLSFGAVLVNMDVELDFWDSLAVAGTVLAGNFSVYFELSLEVAVAPVVFGFSPASIGMGVHQYCGMQMQLIPSRDTGDPVCDKFSFDNLTVPTLDMKDPNSRGMRPEVSRQTLAEAEKLLYAVCGSILAVSMVCALPAVGVSSHRLGKWSLRRLRAARECPAPGAPAPQDSAPDDMDVSPVRPVIVGNACANPLEVV